MMPFDVAHVIPTEYETWLARRLLEHDHRLGLIDSTQLARGLAELPPVVVADEHTED